MRYEVIIDRTVKGASLESREEAVRIVDAALETLGERLSKTMKEHLAAQLPRELHVPVLRRKNTDRFDLDDFYDRVGARAELTRAETVRRVRVAMAVIKDAIGQGEFQHILRELPRQYEEAFGAVPENPVSPSHTFPKGGPAQVP